MIFYPIIPVQPIIPPILPDLFSIFTFNYETVIVFLVSILIIGLSVLTGWIMTKVMQKKNFKTNLAVNMILLGVTAIAMLLRYNITVTAVQGLLLLFVLLYASCSDLTSHTMDDFLWIMIGMLGLCSVTTVGFLSMLIGAAMVFVPQILIVLLPPHKSLGGADIKLSTAIAFLLGWQRGLAALILGLLLAVVVMSIYQKINDKKKKQPFALIPFLSAAAIIMFLI